MDLEPAHGINVWPEWQGCSLCKEKSKGSSSKALQQEHSCSTPTTDASRLQFSLVWSAFFNMPGSKAMIPLACT